MLELRQLGLPALRQVYDWNNGDAQGWDFEEWFRQASASNWIHYGVDREGQLIGCISLEKLNPETASIHLAFAPDAITTAELRPLLIGIGKTMFNHGIQQIEAAAGQHKGAAAIAQRCGLYPLRDDGGSIVYGMKASDYYNDPAKWDNLQ